MKNYNCIEAMKEDIKAYLADNEIEYEGREDLEEKLNDDLWAEDSVTGNASGSYTFNRWEAEKNVLANIDLLKEAYTEFDCKDKFTEDFFSENWEAMDVTIRCYLLGQAIAETLDEIEE